MGTACSKNAFANLCFLPVRTLCFGGEAEARRDNPFANPTEGAVPRGQLPEFDDPTERAIPRGHIPERSKNNKTTVSDPTSDAKTLEGRRGAVLPLGGHPEWPWRNQHESDDKAGGPQRNPTCYTSATMLH